MKPLPAVEWKIKMEFLILSDSHGSPNKLSEIYKRQIKKPDAVFFLGDGIKDLSYCDFENTVVYSVYGNCDFFCGGDDNDKEKILNIYGIKIMMTHGHIYNVKQGLDRIIQKAAAVEADLLLFGHTHKKYEKCFTPEDNEFLTLKKPLYVMNPGAVGNYENSWGCVSLNNGKILISHGQL